MDIAEFIQSREDLQSQEDELRAWEDSLLSNDYGEKCCKTIELRNTAKVAPLPLVTKESMLSWNKLSPANKKNVYSLHRIIILVYSSAVLEDTMGDLTIYLYNAGTQQKIVVCENHPISETAAFVTRWPRAVAMGTDGLALLISKSGVDIAKNGLIGSITPFWEDKQSTKMPYERQLPTLLYPLNLQEPAFFVKNPRQLRGVFAKRIALGQQGTNSDLEAQRIDLIDKGLSASRPTILRPKALPAVHSGLRLEEVVETSAPESKKPAYIKKTPPVKTGGAQ